MSAVQDAVNAKSSNTECVRYADPPMHFPLWAAIAPLLVGCAPQGGLLDEETLSGMGIVSAEGGGETTVIAASRGSQLETIYLDSNDQAVILSGQVNGEGDYKIFAFGLSQAGDRWVIGQESPSDGRMVIALFDENMHLLARSTKMAYSPLAHIMRHECAAVFVGVGTVPGQAGGAYRYRVSRSVGAEIPPPRPQLVWLNFAGVANLTIDDHEDMTFGPFDASVVGEAYAGATDEIKQAIVETLRSVYADYDVAFLTSDETVEPAEPHATIHFGYDDEALLGLADNVDGYNADSGQNAIVFVEHFAAYWTMKLDPQQMGQMIGNSASHELGHLLGLHHTHQADSVMDIAAGDAWDVAGERGFRVADLDPEVFPVGQLNSPRILAGTVGLRAN